jgi:hypothetical protein
MAAKFSAAISSPVDGDSQTALSVSLDMVYANTSPRTLSGQAGFDEQVPV